MRKAPRRTSWNQRCCAERPIKKAEEKAADVLVFFFTDGLPDPTIWRPETEQPKLQPLTSLMVPSGAQNLNLSAHRFQTFNQLCHWFLHETDRLIGAACQEKMDFWVIHGLRRVKLDQVCLRIGI